MYARPSIDRRASPFGVSGRLWHQSLLLFDRPTRSLWSVVDGTAVAGPLAGQRLAELPSEITTWETWRRRHPDGRVLVHPRRPASPYREYQESPTTLGLGPAANPDPRLPLKQLVLGFATPQTALAVPVDTLRRKGWLELDLAGTPLLAAAPPGEATIAAFERRMGNATLHFDPTPQPGILHDRETGSTWQAATGQGLTGPLAAATLRRYPARLIYWGIWARFRPGGGVVGRP